MTPQKGMVGFRPIHDEDAPFLYQLYASTREWEFQHSIWSEADKQDFLQGQFKAQDLHYQQAFPNALRLIIQLDGADVGRLYLDKADDHLRIIEFTLSPESRGRGVGTDILRSLLNEAQGGKVPVRLHVEMNSPALRLYQQHGFVQTGVNADRLAMEWRPQLGPREI